MKNYIWKYGAVGGLISSVLGTLNWILIAKPFGVELSQAVGYLSIAISLLCIPFGVRYFKKKHNKNQVSFGQAFKIGLAITSVAGIVMAIHSVLFFTFQKKEFLQWQKQGLSDAELTAFNEQMAQTPDFVYTPLFQGLVMFVMVFLIGAVINLISALVLKNV